MMPSHCMTPEVQQLHSRVFDLFAIKSVLSYTRALVVIEEVKAGISTAHGNVDNNTSAAAALMEHCIFYEKLCHKGIDKLKAQESTFERGMYCRSRAKRSASIASTVSTVSGSDSNENNNGSLPKRQGIMYQGNDNQHVIHGTEVLTLEEFHAEKDEERVRESKVRWADEVGK